MLQFEFFCAFKSRRASRDKRMKIYTGNEAAQKKSDLGFFSTLQTKTLCHMLRVMGLNGALERMNHPS